MGVVTFKLEGFCIYILIKALTTNPVLVMKTLIRSVISDQKNNDQKTLLNGFIYLFISILNITKTNYPLIEHIECTFCTKGTNRHQ